MRFVRVISAATLVLLILPAAASAQSGRKLPTWTDPKPSPSPTPDEQKQPKEKIDPITLIVSQFTVTVGSSYYANVPIETCLARLKASKSAEISHERDMSRKEATERAKKETTAYVVWLQVDSDYMGMGSGNPYRLFLNYTVLIPGTAKVKTQGRIYQSNVAGGAYDYRLAMIGQEAADHILFALGLPIPR